MEKHPIQKAGFSKLLELKLFSIPVGSIAYEVRPFFTPSSKETGTVLGCDDKQELIKELLSDTPSLVSIQAALPIIICRVSFIDEEDSNYVTIDYEEGKLLQSLITQEDWKGIKEKTTRAILEFLTKN